MEQNVTRSNSTHICIYTHKYLKCAHHMSWPIYTSPFIKWKFTLKKMLPGTTILQYITFWSSSLFSYSIYWYMQPVVWSWLFLCSRYHRAPFVSTLHQQSLWWTTRNLILRMHILSFNNGCYKEQQKAYHSKMQYLFVWKTSLFRTCSLVPKI